MWKKITKKIHRGMTKIHRGMTTSYAVWLLFAPPYAVFLFALWVLSVLVCMPIAAWNEFKDSASDLMVVFRDRGLQNPFS